MFRFELRGLIRALNWTFIQSIESQTNSIAAKLKFDLILKRDEQELRFGDASDALSIVLAYK